MAKNEIEKEIERFQKYHERLKACRVFGKKKNWYKRELIQATEGMLRNLEYIFCMFSSASFTIRSTSSLTVGRSSTKPSTSPAGNNALGPSPRNWASHPLFSVVITSRATALRSSGSDIRDDYVGVKLEILSRRLCSNWS